MKKEDLLKKDFRSPKLDSSN